ncbi:restriction endonuclease subunit S [Lactobacillus helveticus]|uniref:restriction endonuclease subunit S n=3 Tax=Lactobacillus helveticus TaxID=1587 RepID=UPI001C589AB2|nr:restriction endonuclease subunit S [Lactobacillus helveticus]MBW1219702.1 restriction endonuclease subunit S [Lactobacillus helveticus]
MNKKEVKKAPALRFKGFTNDWEERKLGDLSQDTIGGGTPKTSVTEFWNGEIPWIQSSDLANDKLYGVLPKKFITEDAVKNSATKLIPANSIAIVTRVGVGKLAFMPYEFASSQDFLSLSNLQVDCNFGMYSIYKMLQRELNNIQGTSIKGITKADLLDKETFVPIKVEEQQKIGSFFKQLDDTIALQQRKLRLLKLLKKATQQNIFASTECLPKLKYRDLTGKWQLYRLKDVAKITMGQSPNSKNYTQNPIDHILVQGNADIRNGYVFPRIWTTEITKIANRGDIILCVRAPAGDVGRTKFNVVIGRGVVAIKGNDFIFQQLQFMKSSGYWKKYISGSTFESINSNDIKNAKIFCPSQLEQKNISSLLDDIDTSIQIQQKNILDFKYIKQFLLQNMFI